jgi:FtsH-binding integral membrane protein
MVIIYSFLTTTLAISAVLSFLPKPQLNIIVNRSELAEFIMSNFNLWIVLPVIALVIGAIFISRGSNSEPE